MYVVIVLCTGMHTVFVCIIVTTAFGKYCSYLYPVSVVLYTALWYMYPFDTDKVCV